MFDLDLNTLSYRRLVALLKHLRGGSIGFDPFRNPETAKKPDLIAYLNTHWTPSELTAAAASLDATPTKEEQIAMPLETHAPVAAPQAAAQHLAAFLATLAPQLAPIEADAVRAIVAEGKADMVAMARMIDAAVTQKVQGLVVSIPDATALEKSVKAAADAGIPVIVMPSEAK